MFAVRPVVSSYAQRTDEVDFWKQYQNGKDLNFQQRISSISVCQTQPYKYCIPNGHRVSIYRLENDKLNRRVSGFQSRVVVSELRDDGKLIAVGEENGLVRICTTDKNTFHLRKMQAHKGTVKSVKFLLDGRRLASSGSDAVVCLWDVTLGDRIRKFSMNKSTEAISALVVGRDDENLMCCGNLCGDVSFFDVRQSKPTHTLQFPGAISALTLNKNDHTIAVAHDSSVYLWDRRTAQQQYPSPSSDPSYRLHYKLITALCIFNNPDPAQNTEEVLFSVGMDKLFKITEFPNLENELYQFRAPVGLSAVAASPNCAGIIIGGEKGFVKIRHSVSQAQLLPKDTHDSGEVPGGLDPSLEQLMSDFSGHKARDRFISMTTDEWLKETFAGPRRGPKDWLQEDGHVGLAARHGPLIHESSELSRSDFRILNSDSSGEPIAYESLTKVDHMLSRFQHSQALSNATFPRIPRTRGGARDFHSKSSMKNLRMGIGVIRELMRRNTLKAAVAGRDQRQLSRLFTFICRNLWRSEGATVCLELYNTILDLYPVEELIHIPQFKATLSLLRQSMVKMQLLTAASDIIKSFQSEPSTSTSVAGSDCQSLEIPCPVSHVKRPGCTRTTKPKRKKVTGKNIRSKPPEFNKPQRIFARQRKDR